MWASLGLHVMMFVHICETTQVQLYIALTCCYAKLMGR